MSPRRSSDDGRSSFDSTKATLIHHLMTAHRRPSRTTAQDGTIVSDPTQVPHDIFEEHDKLVEELFSRTRSWPNKPTSDNFRKVILGQKLLDTKRPQRARVLATLLLCDVRESSSTWKSFLSSLALGEVPEHESLLIDDNLPLAYDDIKSVLGKDLADAFDNEQYSYCEPIVLRFRDVRKDLVDIFDRVYRTCTHPSKEIHADDGFFPDDVFDNVWREQKTQSLLADLYVETEKWVAPPEPKRERYQAIRKARKEATAFLRCLQPRRKILALLLQCSVEVQSRAWETLLRHCRADVEPDLELCDERLPLSGEQLQMYFGENDNTTFLHNLDARQYYFCAVKLVEKMQVDHSDDSKLHLPLLSSQLVGSGSYGSVFRVRVKGGYLENDDVTLAMKKMSMYSGDEWGKVTWMEEQQLEPCHIMKPRASVIIGDKIYLFYEDAKYGDLKAYFTEHFPQGPGNNREKMRLLDSMYTLATAVEWLHCSIEKQYDEHKVRKMVCIHKDLKAENILVTEELWFKITDFGISSILLEDDSGGQETVYDKSKALPLSKRGTQIHSAKWLPHYPPEAERDGEVNTRGDVWSLGTVFAECLAWMSGGKSALIQLRSRMEGDEGFKYFSRSSEGIPSLKLSVCRWFEKAVQGAKDFDTDSDALLYESCWRLLQDKMLVCDSAQRSDIGVVTACLRKMKDARPVDEIFPREAATDTAGNSQQSQSAGEQKGPSVASTTRQNERTTTKSLATSSRMVHSQRSIEPQQTQEPKPFTKPSDTPDSKAPSHSTNVAGSRDTPDLVKKLFAAVKRGNVQEVQSLLRDGVDVKAKDKYKWTALHHSVHEPHGSADNRNPQVTRLLLETAPSLVHEKNDDGATAMHISAQCGSLQHAEEMWRCSQKPDLRLKSLGNTPLELAQKNRKRSMVDWLMAREKDQDSPQHVERV